MMVSNGEVSGVSLNSGTFLVEQSGWPAASTSKPHMIDRRGKKELRMPDLNPVLIKELRGRMRGARAFVLLTIYLLILSGVTLLFYAAIADVSASDLNAGRQIGKGLFLLIATVSLIEVCLITPALTAGGIAGEKERQTYDLLVSSLLSPWQIAWGKLGAALSFALLMILA